MKPGTGKANKPSRRGLSGTRAGSFSGVVESLRIGRDRASSGLGGSRLANRKLRTAAVLIPELLQVARQIHAAEPAKIVPCVLWAWSHLAGYSDFTPQMVDVVEREAHCSTI